MPKTNEPKVSLMLRTSKATSEGLYPVYLRVAYQGMTEKSTGICVDEAHWSKSERKVMKGFPNYKSLNEQLAKMVSECIDRMHLQRLQKQPYNRLFILNGSPDRVDEKRTFSGLLSGYLRNKTIKDSTMWNWQWIENILKDCFGDSNVDKFSAKKLNAYLDGRGMVDGSKRHVFDKVKALGLDCSDVNYKKFKINRRNGYIPLACMPFVRDMALSAVGVIDGERFRYHDEFIKMVGDRNWSAWAGMWVYLDFLFQGLAPIDLNQIWKRDIEVKRINGNDYYCWDGKRQKTGVDVKVRIKRTIHTNMLISGIITFSGSDRFLPFVSDNLDGIKAQMRSRHMMVSHAGDLKRFWRECNQAIAIYNDEHPDSDEIPYIDESLTWYAVRHSFAMAYVSMPNSSPLALATLMGRSSNTLGAYLETLKEDSTLANSIDIMY